MAASKKKGNEDNVDFEATLEQIESLVVKMENQETSLDQSIQSFEHGVTLIRQAQKALLEAEQKVKVLLEENGKISATNFSEDQAE